jgi:hypothetical protein
LVEDGWEVAEIGEMEDWEQSLCARAAADELRAWCYEVFDGHFVRKFICLAPRAEEAWPGGGHLPSPDGYPPKLLDPEREVKLRVIREAIEHEWGSTLVTARRRAETLAREVDYDDLLSESFLVAGLALDNSRVDALRGYATVDGLRIDVARLPHVSPWSVVFLACGQPGAIPNWTLLPHDERQLQPGRDAYRAEVSREWGLALEQARQRAAERAEQRGTKRPHRPIDRIEH